MRFCSRVKWKSLLLLLWAATPVCGAAQLRPADALDFTYYWRRPFPRLEEDYGTPSLASTPDSKGKDEKSQDISSDLVARHHEVAADRFQWAPAFAQYGLEISIQHAWRFAHEAGTRDATGYGPWFHDWVDSIGETRGWDDGDGWHASYVGHPLNGGIYGFIAQQNDPLYRKVEWGDGRIYWMARLRALGFAAVASAQWTLGPLSEASLGNVQLHASPGFIDLVQTPGLGVLEMMGEDMLDRYVVIPLENHTSNPWLLLAGRSLCNPARSFATLMSLHFGWQRENRPGLFGANHAKRKELVGEYKRGLISAPFSPHTPEQKAAMNQAIEGPHPKEAPIELQTYAVFESFQVLFGGSRVTYEVVNPELRDSLLKEWDDGKGILPHYPKRSDYQVQYQALGFNLTMGGGFDASFGRAFAWRVLDLNYSHSWMPDVHSIDASNGLQVRTGVVLRIGNW